MAIEVWKDVLGYKGLYQVSSEGRVKSLPFKQRYLLRNGAPAYRVTAERILSQHPINSGYLIVHLYYCGKRRARTVHRLVAEVFVNGTGKTVNHKDGNKRNNAAANLEWCSLTANHLHAVGLQLNKQAIPVAHPETGERYASIAQAAKRARVRHRTAAKWARA